MIRQIVSIVLLSVVTVGWVAIIKTIPEDNQGLQILSAFIGAALLLTLTFKVLMLPFVFVGMVIGVVTFVSTIIGGWITGAIERHLCRLYLRIFEPDKLAILDAEERESGAMQKGEVEPVAIEPLVR